jgi:hypothetical protein
VRDALETDLWTLDAPWWFLDQSEPNGGDDETGELTEGEIIAPSSTAAQHFGLERHLHQILRDNWNRIELSKDWAIYSEPGEEEAGYEYPCDIGRIDLLAKHKREGRWLVIELKLCSLPIRQWVNFCGTWGGCASRAPANPGAPGWICA